MTDTEHWHADIPNEGPRLPGGPAATDVHRDRNVSLTWSKKNIPVYLSTAFFKPITAILSSEKSIAYVYINKEYSSVGCLALRHYKEIPSGACGRTDWDRCN